MVTFLITTTLTLLMQVAGGSLFTLLWNLGASTAFALPSVTLLQGIGVYMMIRLILSPPTLELTLRKQ